MRSLSSSTTGRRHTPTTTMSYCHEPTMGPIAEQHATPCGYFAHLQQCAAPRTARARPARAAGRPDVEASTEVHRPPDASVAGRDDGDSGRDRGCKGVTTYVDQRCTWTSTTKVGPPCSRAIPTPLADQRDQAGHEDDVRDPLARVEVDPRAGRTGRSHGLGPGGEPGQVLPAEAERLPHERRQRRGHRGRGRATATSAAPSRSRCAAGCPGVLVSRDSRRRAAFVAEPQPPAGGEQDEDRQVDAAWNQRAAGSSARSQ